MTTLPRFAPIWIETRVASCSDRISSTSRERATGALAALSRPSAASRRLPPGARGNRRTAPRSRGPTGPLPRRAAPRSSAPPRPRAQGAHARGRPDLALRQRAAGPPREAAAAGSCWRCATATHRAARPGLLLQTRAPPSSSRNASASSIGLRSSRWMFSISASRRRSASSDSRRTTGHGRQARRLRRAQAPLPRDQLVPPVAGLAHHDRLEDADLPDRGRQRLRSPRRRTVVRGCRGFGSTALTGTSRSPVSASPASGRPGSAPTALARGHLASSSLSSLRNRRHRRLPSLALVVASVAPISRAPRFRRAASRGPLRSSIRRAAPASARIVDDDDSALRRARQIGVSARRRAAVRSASDSSQTPRRSGSRSEPSAIDARRSCDQRQVAAGEPGDPARTATPEPVATGRMLDRPPRPRRWTASCLSLVRGSATVGRGARARPALRRPPPARAPWALDLASSSASSSGAAEGPASLGDRRGTTTVGSSSNVGMGRLGRRPQRNLASQLPVGLGASGLRVVDRDRLAVAGRLGQPDGPRDDDVVHEVPEVTAEPPRPPARRAWSAGRTSSSRCRSAAGSG